MVAAQRRPSLGGCDSFMWWRAWSSNTSRIASARIFSSVKTHIWWRKGVIARDSWTLTLLGRTTQASYERLKAGKLFRAQRWPRPERWPTPRINFSASLQLDTISRCRLNPVKYTHHHHGQIVTLCNPSKLTQYIVQCRPTKQNVQVLKAIIQINDSPKRSSLLFLSNHGLYVCLHTCSAIERESDASSKTCIRHR